MNRQADRQTGKQDQASKGRQHPSSQAQAHADTNVNITKQIHTNMSHTKQGQQVQQVRTTPSSSHA